MSTVETFPDIDTLAQQAALSTVTILGRAIDKYGQASWVLAGGSTPLAAYKVIARDHRSTLDWSKVTLLLGDERISESEGPDNNWHTVDSILAPLAALRLRPHADSAEAAAADYETALLSLPKNASNLPRLDLVWLGVGEDGHTLSLFPKHDSLHPTTKLVIPVYNSPKPPSDRISLSLRSLQGAKHAIILASGKSKQAAVKDALDGKHSPIALAASIIETYGGTVTWLLDSAATTD